MEKKMRGLSALTFGFVILILSACHSEAMTCPEALVILLPCKPFLEGALPDSPNFLCCLGVQKLTQEASTTETRRAVCQCLKNATLGFHINLDRAKQIPQLCHINDPIPIDPNVDCNTLR
ncbi:non-specific lipid-transfer protein 1-like [Juglans microcarpa x Juglans regia]|uniref:non-specific lipid-transfer protein 1-like n=1 Tax=Juglans microcarpa x Juglans regia TaxID=2249226 RepID=UPI001B7E209D|nr:non-specific lipid-transfer protein 1-like [Juglans microcarpa x Juglans regia]